MKSVRFVVVVVVVIMAAVTSANAQAAVTATLLEGPTWLASGYAVDPATDMSPNSNTAAVWIQPKTSDDDEKVTDGSDKNRLMVSVKVLGSSWQYPAELSSEDGDTSLTAPQVAINDNGKVVVAWHLTRKVKEKKKTKTTKPLFGKKKTTTTTTTTYKQGVTVASYNLTSDLKLEEVSSDSYWLDSYETTGSDDENSSGVSVSASCSLPITSSESADGDTAVNVDAQCTTASKPGEAGGGLYSGNVYSSDSSTGVDGVCNGCDGGTTDVPSSSTSPDSSDSSTVHISSVRKKTKHVTMNFANKRKKSRGRSGKRLAHSSSTEVEGINGTTQVFKGDREDSLFTAKDEYYASTPWNDIGQRELPEVASHISVGIDKDDNAVAVWHQRVKGQDQVVSSEQRGSGAWTRFDISKTDGVYNDSKIKDIDAALYHDSIWPVLKVNDNGEAVVVWVLAKSMLRYWPDLTESYYLRMAKWKLGTSEVETRTVDSIEKIKQDEKFGEPGAPTVEINSQGDVAAAWTVTKQLDDWAFFKKRRQAIRLVQWSHGSGKPSAQDAVVAEGRLEDLGWPKLALNSKGDAILGWNSAELIDKSAANKFWLGIPRNMPFTLSIGLFTLTMSRGSGISMGFGPVFTHPVPGAANDVYNLVVHTKTFTATGSAGAVETPQSNTPNQYLGDLSLDDDGSARMLFDGQEDYSQKEWAGQTYAAEDWKEESTPQWKDRNGKVVDVVENPYDGRPLYIKKGSDSSSYQWLEKGGQYVQQIAERSSSGDDVTQGSWGPPTELYKSDHTTVWSSGVDTGRLEFDDAGNGQAAIEYGGGVGVTTIDREAPTVKSYPDDGAKAYTLPDTEGKIPIAAADYGGLKSLTVNFGDSKTSKVEGVEGKPSASSVVTHEWANAGIYRVAVIAEDSAGNESRNTFTVQVLATQSTELVADSTDLSTVSSKSASISLPGVPSWWFDSTLPAAPPASYGRPVELLSQETKPVLWEFSANRKILTAKRKTVTFTVGTSQAVGATVTIYKLKGSSKVKQGSLAKASLKEGLNKIKFRGRLGKKKLKTGRYVAIVRAKTASGTKATARSLKFKVTK